MVQRNYYLCETRSFEEYRAVGWTSLSAKLCLVYCAFDASFFDPAWARVTSVIDLRPQLVPIRVMRASMAVDRGRERHVLLCP